MTRHRKILNFIGLIRDSDPNSGYLYTHGGCMNLFCILHSVYPEATAWYNCNHIITKIGDYFYDIGGIVMNTENYIPYTQTYRKKRSARGFKQMYEWT